ncbi:hypothetical protein [Moraxella nonliquefaciens]|uniref:Uncharacterized protein n=1 Tax=Moraxella nonliquefaciens TaxID=478 RepID=A0A1B8QMJ5_MORNO|nr:hypothetical protein A7456_02590 [Moraxella nonliquefaciens]
MSIHHIHDFDVLNQLNAKFTNLLVQETADSIPTIWVACDKLLDVLLFLRTLPKPFVMLVDLFVLKSR